MQKFEALKNRVVQDGWHVENIEIPSDHWWAYEIWKITSVWSPVGKTAFLVLAFDPMPDDEKPNEENVTSIILSSELPRAWNDGLTIYIKPKWERGLIEFFEALPKFRDLL